MPVKHRRQGKQRYRLCRHVDSRKDVLKEHILKDQCLPSSTPFYKYVADSIEDLAQACNEQELSTEKDTYFVLLGVSQEELRSGGPFTETKLFWREYDANRRALTVLISNIMHPTAASEFRMDIDEQLFKMGLMDMRHRGISSAPFPLNGPGGVRRPDESLYPDPKTLPEGRSDTWPSLAIEVGKTDSAGRLKTARDAIAWLRNSNGDVRMAIGIDILEARGGGSNKLRLSAYKGGGVKPIRRTQFTVVSYPAKESHEDEGEGRMRTQEAPFIVPLRDLILREPEASKDERDIVFSRAALESLAKKVFCWP
ncbi:hypothetical protein KEM55_007995 [Ascosphaera atra]|nr:hypothetical protein KEM55_007995 [Ascosphaera atra]